MIDKFILYTNDECPFCMQAATLLSELNYDHKVISFSGNQELLTEVYSGYDWATVPIVFGKDNSTGQYKLIGGYTDLLQFIDKREDNGRTEGN